MTTDLTGRTAIVTGGSRGIGLAAAQALLDAGATVILTSRDQEAADVAAASLNSERAIGYGAEVTDEEASAACISFAVETYGGLDILVNNAGTNSAVGAVVDQDRARFAETLAVNLWGPVLWTGLAWRAWMREHGGVVVNTASIGGFLVGPNLGTYGASKAALIYITRHLAVELAPRVRVNAVAPGVVRTRLSEPLWKDGREAEFAERIPLGRIGEPPDIGATVAFLASDAASWITGQTVVMDGGTTLGAPFPEAAPEASA
jgi:NAD(P)-dependent dehydrogenase (short-subunit alcohol dehydrogenase family)